MDRVDPSSRLPIFLRRILPALIGVLLFGLFVFSMGAGAVRAAVRAAVEPEALGTISGVVRDVASQPITGVNVTLFRNVEGYGWTAIRSVQTDDSGAYQFIALRAGIYRLHFRDSQRRYAQEFYRNATTLLAATDVPVAGNDVSGIDTSLTPAAMISGTVSILATLPPDQGFVQLFTQVGAYWQPVTSTAILTPTGAFQVGELFSGTYRVCAYAFLGSDIYQDTFYGCYGGITVDKAHDIQLATGETRTNIDLSLGDGQYDSQITGRVTADGTPLAGIKVSLYSYFIPAYPDPTYLPLVYTYTNAAGDYQLGGLQAGVYLVSFTDPEGNYTTRYFENQRRPELAQSFFVPEGATMPNVNANLQRAGFVSGRIRSADGRGAGFVQMYLYLLSGDIVEGELRQVQTDEAGNYTVKGLEPGVYRICVPFEVALGYPYPIYWNYYSNCYGADRFSPGWVESGTDIAVVAGETTGGIDFTIGPSLAYAPGVHSQ
jgi:5-hydroxyisourate hydrolase-like protein (transthyretin family)